MATKAIGSDNTYSDYVTVSHDRPAVELAQSEQAGSHSNNAPLQETSQMKPDMQTNIVWEAIYQAAKQQIAEHQAAQKLAAWVLPNAA
jgi:hypothetical protein